jgi:hypothetical protein
MSEDLRRLLVGEDTGHDGIIIVEAVATVLAWRTQHAISHPVGPASSASPARAMRSRDLHAARKAAADRFFALGMSYVPSGWTVCYRISLSGQCHYADREIHAPKPVTRKSLYIFLHECAHAQLHYPIWLESKSRYAKFPKHVVEMQAEKWAHEKMREHGIAVPRDMTKRAKRYVARKIRQAERHGAKKINAKAKRFALG